jgi:hypothetical protein
VGCVVINRWRVKLVQQQRDGNSTHTTDRNTLAEYLGKYLDDYADEEFEKILSFFHGYIDSMACMCIVEAM